MNTVSVCRLETGDWRLVTGDYTQHSQLSVSQYLTSLTLSSPHLTNFTSSQPASLAWPGLSTTFSFDQVVSCTGKLASWHGKYSLFGKVDETHTP